MFIKLPENNNIKQYFPIFPVTLGLDNLQRDVCRPAGTKFHHLLCITEGEGYFDLGGTVRILGAGSAVFIRGLMPVEYRSASGNFKTAWVTFDGLGAEGIFKHFNVEGYAILDNRCIENRVATLCSLAESNISPELLSSRVYELVIEFFTLLKKQNTSPLIEKAKEYMEQNYRQDISMEQLSESVGAAQSQIFKLFQRDQSCTPMEYLRSVRISRAGQLLIENKLKIYQIASECGFSDAAYFCKIFKAQTGYTPASYRKRFL
jgi:AraC-like DNA-binding protein